MTIALDPTTLKQIGDAAERAGGNLDDARALAELYLDLQAQLQQANELYRLHRDHDADRLYSELEAQFAKPLSHLARDVIRQRQQAVSR